MVKKRKERLSLENIMVGERSTRFNSHVIIFHNTYADLRIGILPQSDFTPLIDMAGKYLIYV